MLCVETKIGPSKIHGIGLFAAEFIPKGTVVWRFTPGFDARFTAQQILRLPAAVQIYLTCYAWKSKKSGLYCLASDGAKHFNHSNTPNCRSRYEPEEPEVVTRAVKNIRVGTEITDDYASFAHQGRNVLDKIYEKYLIADAFPHRKKV